MRPETRRIRKTFSWWVEICIAIEYPVRLLVPNWNFGTQVKNRGKGLFVHVMFLDNQPGSDAERWHEAYDSV